MPGDRYPGHLDSKRALPWGRKKIACLSSVASSAQATPGVQAERGSGEKTVFTGGAGPWHALQMEFQLEVYSSS
jgi:hypothetical protein